VTTNRRERWERATTIPLIVLGGTFIVSYSLWVLMPTRPDWLTALLLLDAALAWIAFLSDYVVRLALTARRERWAFVRSTPVDLLSVFLPMFRAFRVVALLRNVPYFRTSSGTAVRTEVIAYATAYAVIFVYFIALATLDAERGAPEATITDFGSALWWACVTLATVGYGDTYPVTAAGRVTAVMLMVGGVAIIGTASAIVISYITEKIQGRVGASNTEVLAPTGMPAPTEVPAPTGAPDKGDRAD
jgi:voltage-gated potassium channel